MMKNFLNSIIELLCAPLFIILITLGIIIGVVLTILTGIGLLVSVICLTLADCLTLGQLQIMKVITDKVFNNI